MNNNKLRVFVGRCESSWPGQSTSGGQDRTQLGDSLGKITISNFPDGETQVRIKEDVSRDVFVVTDFVHP